MKFSSAKNRFHPAGAGLIFLLILLCPIRVQAAQINLLTDHFIDCLDRVFPPVELFVISTTPPETSDSQYKIFLEPSSRVNMIQGMELDLIRKGQPFRHPVTGVVLEYFNRKLGVVRINRITSPDMLTCHLVTPLPDHEVKVGDFCRITSLTIPVAVLLTRENRLSLLTDQLLFKTKERERYRIAPPENAKKLAKEFSLFYNSKNFPQKIKRFCSKLGVRALVFWHLTEKKETMISRIQIFSGVSGKPMMKFFSSIQ
ncbi:MAG: hypothetical protein ACE5GM_01025 [bacterium]